MVLRKANDQVRSTWGKRKMKIEDNGNDTYLECGASKYNIAKRMSNRQGNYKDTGGLWYKFLECCSRWASWRRSYIYIYIYRERERERTYQTRGHIIQKGLCFDIKIGSRHVPRRNCKNQNEDKLSETVLKIKYLYWYEYIYIFLSTI